MRSTPPDQLTHRLSLLENAYDSLNESMLKVEATSREPRQWKFAVLHVVHAVELMLKERLRREHRLFLYENIDKQAKTVSLEGALTRLGSIDVAIPESELTAIRTAIKWRNQITHHNVDLQLAEVRQNYLLLFEFLWEFHQSHFNEALSEHFQQEHVSIAADLVASFKEELIDFQGRRMHRSWPAKLLAGQNIHEVPIAGINHTRIPWGSELIWTDESMGDARPAPVCRDCACLLGELHGPMCCLEECPSCFGQFISCDCDYGENALWEIIEHGLEELSNRDES